MPNWGAGFAINDKPDGLNINKGAVPRIFPRCRSMYQTGADLGFAFDGDADRVLAVDERAMLWMETGLWQSSGLR